MDIKQAKQELRQSIRAYTAKTADGLWRMPLEKQRPVLLMGPPGIGKTAILSQLAREEHVGLVSYTMTHHTRQSALGLPVIVDRAESVCKIAKVNEQIIRLIVSAPDDTLRVKIKED